MKIESRLQTNFLIFYAIAKKYHFPHLFDN